jgi:hypothetical protein
MSAEHELEDDALPKFKRDAAGTLTPEQRDIADRAKDRADDGKAPCPPEDPNSPFKPAQHCSHGSHGSHGSW